MSRSDYPRPISRTLLEQPEKSQIFADHANGNLHGKGGDRLEHHLGTNELIGPVGIAVLWATALGMVHFTLDVLVHTQYQQQIEWLSTLTRTGTVVPVIFLVVYMTSSKTAKELGTLRSLLIFAVGVVAGCYTIHLTNRYDYFAVMTQAPPIGTLWIWSVAEMNLGYAAASVLIDVWFLWWKGYSAY